ncbi:class I SAM-dependent methyltransferase [Pseudanabaena sp. FACHB-1998]|uniref:class I SAM-dependent methyltransferase n=1 Tax=Pseudanabaena sp. FACHB-1998 TaxID=2692858 RepID=UPI00168057BF|nr:class I SAM-dependent methyltransferase [Pseudanabaena sp. FACHB-1998]MBD2176971.1 class I SAM-dependent methyltransferase [Pseudanabaena sp. FACHB-1998]
MKTDYRGHDRAYQRNRQDPNFEGWSSGYEEDWVNSWLPLIQNHYFPKQGKLLELGCGAGNLSIRFAQQGYEVVGVDIAPTAIDWATENAAKLGVKAIFLTADVLQLAEIEDNSVDIALDGRCFHCLIDRDRQLFLKNVYRVLKPKGIFAVNTMCNEVPATASWLANFDQRSRCTIHGEIATRYIGDSNDILQEIIQSNFRILNMEIVPPQNVEDIADLRAIALKP